MRGPAFGSAWGSSLLLTGLLLCGCTPAQAPGPEERRELFQRAEQALVEGNAPAAEATLREGLARAGDDPLLVLQLCRSLLAQGRWAEASVECRIPLVLDPSLAEAAYNTACALARLGQEEDALHFAGMAWAAGLRDPEQYLGDPDLRSLRSDERFRALLETGALGPAGRVAHLTAEPEAARAGEPVELGLTVLDLDRSPLDPPGTLVVSWAGTRSLPAARPVARIERFDAGGSGGREAQRHKVVWRFIPLQVGPLLLGPLAVDLDEERLGTQPTGVQVGAGVEDFPTSELTPLAADWFTNPSAVFSQPSGGSPVDTGPPPPEGLRAFSRGGQLWLDVEVALPSGQLDTPPRLELGGTEVPESELQLTAWLRRSTFGASRLRLALACPAEASPQELRLSVGPQTWTATLGSCTTQPGG